MNIVFVKHAGNNKKYAFEVPDFLVEYIKPGMDVLVKNARGFCIAHTISGVISGNGALDAAKMLGMREPTQPVISIITDEVVKYVRDEVLRTINILSENWYSIDSNPSEGLMHCCEIEVNKREHE